MTTPNQGDLERKLITIASGKGGVGKTWFSVTLGHTLARMGRRVLIFDGDLGLANVDIQLGIIPKIDVGDVISGRADLTSAITSYQDPVNKDGQLDILAGKSGSGTLGILAREKLKSLKAGLTAIAAQYDHVIFDLAAGVDAAVTTFSSHDGIIITVMSADPTSLTDAYAFIKLNIMRNPKADIKIVVNNVSSLAEGKKAFGAIKKACEGFLKYSPQLAGIIRTDKRVVESIRSQTPILSRYPQSEAAAEVAEISRLFPAQPKAMAG